VWKDVEGRGCGRMRKDVEECERMWNDVKGLGSM
jgi:hypothetical protein